ncbi:MAG TPA: hypothetical protein VKY36_05535 [Moheibacter sp.]|nr:hypothetical protein [Moheibacter sp.]
MRSKLFIGVILLGSIGIYSCLDSEDSVFYPTVAQTNHAYYGKGEKDSLPPNDHDSITRPDTGGETGQNPVKP